MFNKLCRIGNDPELRFTTGSNPTAVLSLSLAYSYGKKGQDGKKPTQWISAALFGKQAEAVKDYLKKGDQISVAINDLHIEEYESKGVKGHKLSGQIVSFDFVSSGSNSKPAQEQEAKPAAKSNANDFYDDIPW